MRGCRPPPWVDGVVPRPCRHARVLPTSTSSIDGRHCWQVRRDDGGRAVQAVASGQRRMQVQAMADGGVVGGRMRTEGRRASGHRQRLQASVGSEVDCLDLPIQALPAIRKEQTMLARINS
ncbi:hypothetical protein ACLOJK_014834 [Asimina triloba]